MKEFDVILSKRLTECDIIVQNIPYRDGITVTNRLLIECCLNEYLLQKAIAVECGSVLVERIDRMIKTCYEMLSVGTSISASVVFDATSDLASIGSSVAIGVEDVSLHAETYEKATNAILVAVEPFKLHLKKVGGLARSGIAIAANVSASVKTDYERFDNGVDVGASVDASFKRIFETPQNRIELGVNDVNLLYHLYQAGESVMEIVAELKDITIRHSLGKWSDGIVLGADADFVAEKALEAEHALLLLAEVTETIILYASPTETALELNAQARGILRRLRKLSEIDPETVADIDSTPLDTLDFTILED